MKLAHYAELFKLVKAMADWWTTEAASGIMSSATVKLIRLNVNWF